MYCNAGEHRKILIRLRQTQFLRNEILSLFWFDFPCEQPHQASPPLAVIILSPSTTNSFKYSVAEPEVD